MEQSKKGGSPSREFIAVVFCPVNWCFLSARSSNLRVSLPRVYPSNLIVHSIDKGVAVNRGTMCNLIRKLFAARNGRVAATYLDHYELSSFGDFV
jgi:hypothetical protein